MLIWLLLSQGFQIRSLDILYEHIGSFFFGIIKHFINMRQCRMVQLLDPSPFGDEAIPHWLI